jgi:acetylornithine deacetylase/succinyl-diaminopimelate desuccinylase-like protein
MKKSGVMITIWAVEAMLSTDGKLPVNVKFIFDGEEEKGSPNFKTFINANKELLKADFAVNADGMQYSETYSVNFDELKRRSSIGVQCKNC